MLAGQHTRTKDQINLNDALMFAYIQLIQFIGKDVEKVEPDTQGDQAER
jgi:hypothetical protein